MASVQELILAAESANQARRKFSPFADLVNNFTTNYDQSQARQLETTIKLMQIDAMRQQNEQQAMLKKEMADAQFGNATKQGFGGVESKAPVLPQQKFKTKISSGKDGITKTIEYGDDAVASKERFSTEKYVDANGRTRIGRVSNLTGDIEQRPNDPLAPAPGATDKSMERAITKAKVNLATTRPMVTQVISEIERVEKLNEGSLGGTVGAARMKLSRATGVGDESDEFKRTADVVNTMQSQVAKVLKSTFGGQLSDGEREYLNGVYGALSELTVSERAIAMKNVKTMLNAKLDGDQETLNELLSDAGIGAGAIEQDTEETPEQRKARLLQELEESE